MIPWCGVKAGATLEMSDDGGETWREIGVLSSDMQFEDTKEKMADIAEAMKDLATKKTITFTCTQDSLGQTLIMKPRSQPPFWAPDWRRGHRK